MVNATPEGVVHPAWMMLEWFSGKFLPWSLFVLFAILVAKPRWFRHPMGPATLWLLVLIVGFSFSTANAWDYLLPAYAPGSLLAAWAILMGLRMASRKFPLIGTWRRQSWCWRWPQTSSTTIAPTHSRPAADIATTPSPSPTKSAGSSAMTRWS